jgi:TPR repeat protein
MNYFIAVFVGLLYSLEPLVAEDAATKLDAGISAFRAGNLDGALQLLGPLAENNNSQAQCFVGEIKEKRGDLVSAHMWFNLSAAQGDMRARALRKALSQRLSADELAEAQQRASDFQRRWLKASTPGLSESESRSCRAFLSFMAKLGSPGCADETRQTGDFINFPLQVPGILIGQHKAHVLLHRFKDGQCAAYVVLEDVDEPTADLYLQGCLEPGLTGWSVLIYAPKIIALRKGRVVVYAQIEGTERKLVGDSWVAGTSIVVSSEVTNE